MNIQVRITVGHWIPTTWRKLTKESENESERNSFINNQTLETLVENILFPLLLYLHRYDNRIFCKIPTIKCVWEVLRQQNGLDENATLIHTVFQRVERPFTNGVELITGWELIDNPEPTTQMSRITSDEEQHATKSVVFHSCKMMPPANNSEYPKAPWVAIYS